MLTHAQATEPTDITCEPQPRLPATTSQRSKPSTIDFFGGLQYEQELPGYSVDWRQTPLG